MRSENAALTLFFCRRPRSRKPFRECGPGGHGKKVAHSGILGAARARCPDLLPEVEHMRDTANALSFMWQSCYSIARPLWPEPLLQQILFTLTSTAITGNINGRPPANSKGINDRPFLRVKGVLDVRRLGSRIPHHFWHLPEKHAPAMFQERRNLFSSMSQFCNTLHVNIVPRYGDPWCRGGSQLRGADAPFVARQTRLSSRRGWEDGDKGVKSFKNLDEFWATVNCPTKKAHGGRQRGNAGRKSVWRHKKT